MFTLAFKKPIILPPAFDETQPFKIISLEDNTTINFINGTQYYKIKNSVNTEFNLSLSDSITLNKNEWIEITGYPAVDMNSFFTIRNYVTNK